MKAVRVSTWKFELDNEAKKAIRFCMGFNTDLRVSLGSTKYPKSTSHTRLVIWNFLEANLENILGIDFGLSQLQPTDPDWDNYGRCLNDIADQIMNL